MNSMSYINTVHSEMTLMNFHQSTRNVILWGMAFLTIAITSVMLFSFEWIPIAIAMSVLGGVVIIKKPIYWLYFVAATMRFMLHDDEDGFSIIELTLGLFYITTLLFWLYWHCIVQRKPMIRSKPDLFFISFIFFIPLNGIIAVTNEVELIKWFREIHNYIFLLYYFPIREYITSKKELIIFLIIIGLGFTSLSIQNIIAYKRATTDAQYAFQLIFARSAARVNSIYFSVCAAFGFVALSYVKNQYFRIAVAAFVLITVVASLASMARTSWVIVITSALFSILFTPKNNRLFYYTAFVTIMGCTIAGVMLFGGKNVGLVKKIIEKRLSSVGTLNDYSYLTRVNENIVAWEYIQQYPLGGSGIGKNKLHYDLVTKNHAYVSYIHNGYISLIYKLGIPMALLFFSFLIGYLFISLRYFFLTKTALARGLSLSCMLALIVYFISNIAGCVFDIRQGVFLTFIIIGLINTVPSIENSLQKNNGELSWQK